jgi:hypothetical protein
MGMSEADVFRLIGARPDPTGSLTTKAVPRPDAAFETYRLTISPALGLCRVSGIGKNITIDGSGRALKAAFASRVDELVAHYGPPSGRVDHLSRSSLLDDPKDWTKALLQEERLLVTYWDPPAGASDLSGITLRALALNPSTGYLLLAYEGKDYKLCRDEAAERREAPR